MQRKRWNEKYDTHCFSFFRVRKNIVHIFIFLVRLSRVNPFKIRFKKKGARRWIRMSSYKRRKPIMKIRMRDWLTNLLDNKSIPGLEWMDKSKQIFRIPWKHGSRQTWKVDDADLFVKWAEHGGKYNQTLGNPNTKRYKATFRCALNSLPDCEELKKDSRKSGLNAFKVYQFKDEHKRKRSKHQEHSDEDSLKSFSESSDMSSPKRESFTSSDEECHLVSQFHDQQSGGVCYRTYEIPQLKTEDGSAQQIFNTMMGYQVLQPGYFHPLFCNTQGPKF
ncbi:interferon regulatory factor 2 isoform X4 [Octopus bimaculoides]|uniref:interferon regulatory factor 2 isoform X4 n=1 Tax=Octopus bimaculoides TaxID=37653 RepID=UPI0022DEB7A0|nr:interferon regulatory factor 2 isoform X4 [Octopus bimaculoides]